MASPQEIEPQGDHPADQETQEIPLSPVDVMTMRMSAMSMVDAWIQSGDVMSLLNGAEVIIMAYSDREVYDKQIEGIEVAIMELEAEKDRDDAARKKERGIGFLAITDDIKLELDPDNEDEDDQIALLNRLKLKLEEDRNAIAKEDGEAIMKALEDQDNQNK